MGRFFCILLVAAASVSCVVESYDKPLATDPGWWSAGYAAQDMVRKVSVADLVRILVEWDSTVAQEEKDTYGNRYFRGLPLRKVDHTIEVVGLCRVETRGSRPERLNPWTVVFDSGTGFGGVTYHVFCISAGEYWIYRDASEQELFEVELPSNGRPILSGANYRYRVESGSFPGFYAYDAFAVTFESPSEPYTWGWPLPLEPVSGRLGIARYVFLGGSRQECYDPEFGRVECTFLPEGGVNILWREFEHQYGYFP